MAQFQSFAALGDSFTEGVGDPGVDGPGLVGWADRFAEHLAVRQPGLRYANLAVRGKLLSEVLDEQVPAAVQMRADLVSVAAGGNDLLRPSTNPDDLAVMLETAVTQLTGAGATVMMFTGFDPKAFPVLRLIRGKSAVLTMHVHEIARRHNCLIVDLWQMHLLTDRRLWQPDRLHLTPDGHRRVALLACEVAGLAPGEDWREPLHESAGTLGDASTPATWIAARWNDMQWVLDYAAPYLSRRLHGISSGDGVTAKRPELTVLHPADAASKVSSAEPSVA
ncbi:MAG: SGNH/GDSL hydrolase family protein [Nocardiopsaceae bacterium]|nr:SGNH/GDSL hydrolase family protein [Nocardiopsaceae bacterium]